jgi:hypothetical protein
MSVTVVFVPDRVETTLMSSLANETLTALSPSPHADVEGPKHPASNILAMNNRTRAPLRMDLGGGVEFEKSSLNSDGLATFKTG